jgi:hypothetical protein
VYAEVSRSSMNSDLAKLRRRALLQGWSVRLNGSGHLEWRSPQGNLVITSSTPSAQNAIRRIRHDLEKAGLDLRGGRGT